MKRVLIIISITGVISLIGYLAGLNPKQIISATIFSLFIASTLLFWRFRLAFALIGTVLLFLSGVLDIEHFIKFANFDIIFFLIGMMTAVGFLEKRHFFEHLVGKMIVRIGPRGKLLMAIMMVLSGFFGAIVDEVTSILFMTAIMLQLTTRFKLNPLPYVLMIVFATNIGSSATVIGNPIGVLIAFKGGLTFVDFLRWATPISIVVLFLSVGICLLYFSKAVARLDSALKEETGLSSVADISRKDITTSWIFISITIPLLIFHTVFETLLGLDKNIMLLGASFIAAGVALIIDRREAKVLFEKSVDWWTLVFFAFFFASVGTLKLMGTIDIVGRWLVSLAQGSDNMVFFIFTGATAALTPVMDNVLVVAVFVPIVELLPELGYQDFPVWWGMLFGGTLFGNLTMIGSTANIVAVGILESRGMVVSLKKWIKAGAVISIPTFIIAIILLYIQIPLMPK